MARKKKRRTLLTLALLTLFAFISVIALIFWADRQTILAGNELLFDQANEVPETPVALVFGCAKTINGRENLYFKYRIEAASELWKEQKVQGFIVSGDNRTHHYNEPEDMKAALIAQGVPPERIVCDFAGLRTLDSIVRAKEIFGLEKIVLVSQKFHNQRAAYLAKAHGIQIVGLNATTITGSAGTKTRLREKLARVKMWLDVNLLKTRPRHLGQKETLPFLN